MRVNRRKLLRLAAALFAVLLFLLVAAYAFLLWESHRQRQRAEELFRELQVLKIGETSANEAMKIVLKHGGKLDSQSYSFGCGTEVSWYNLAPISSSNVPFDIQLANRLLNNMGARPWGVSASVVIEGDRLVCWHYGGGTMRSDGLSLDFNLRVEPPVPEVIEWGKPLKAQFARSGRDTYMADFPVHTGVGAAEGLSVQISHEATSKERRRAFDINFECFTQLGECRRVCELLPSAWKEVVRSNQAGGYDPHPTESDPRCHAVLAATQKQP